MCIERYTARNLANLLDKRFTLLLPNFLQCRQLSIGAYLCCMCYTERKLCEQIKFSHSAAAGAAVGAVGAISVREREREGEQKCMGGASASVCAS